MLRAKIEALEKAIAMQQELNKNQQGWVDQFEEKLKEKNKRLLAAESENAKLKQQLAEKQQAQKNQLMAIHLQFEEEKQRLDQMSKEWQNTSDIVSKSLEQEQQSLRQQEQALEEAYEQLAGDEQDLEEERTLYEKQKKALAEEKKKKKMLDNEIEKKLALLEAKEAQLNQKEKALTERKKVLDELKEKHQALNAKLQKHQEEVHQVQKAVPKLKKELDDKIQENKEKEKLADKKVQEKEEIVQIEKENNQLAVENHALRMELFALEESIKRLNEKLLPYHPSQPSDEPGSSKNQSAAAPIVLQGQLPESSEVVYFTEEILRSDGDCGFTALGASREQVVQTLLALQNNQEAREFLSDEIQEALMTKEFVTEKGNRYLQVLYAQQEKESHELRKVREQFSALPHFATNTLTQTIHWLHEDGGEAQAEQLQALNLQTFQAEDELLRYCKTPEAFGAYVKALKQQVWLGYKSALLYAKAKEMSLYIWAKSEEDSKALILQNHAKGDSGHYLHMLSTGGFTHFNLLVEESYSEENSQIQSNNTSVNRSNSSTQTQNNQPHPLVDNKGIVTYSLNIPFDKLSPLTPDKLLGHGSFGQVYKGKYGKDTVAIKRLININPAALEEFKLEVGMMARLRSSYVISLKGACFEPGRYCLVMEYAPRGSLDKVLRSQDELSWETRYQIAAHISLGIHYLHEQGIVHADLKTDNVVLDKYFQAKITDFGCSKIKISASVKTLGPEHAGTYCWMAPEVLEDKPTTKASDIYSFSLILWALGACNRPFAGKSVTQLIDHVYRQDKRETITEDTPPSMAKLIGQCWQKRPENRPLIETVVDTLKEEQRIMFGH